ncbi:MAG: hypothetical protein EPN23_00540 [Verrucomicrobia bacterium]|nr:MAG: hypothetical protein EPN23_00540 [Verrucomicrobiota bacterium]
MSIGKGLPTENPPTAATRFQGLEKIDAARTMQQKKPVKRFILLLSGALALTTWAAPVVLEENFSGPLSTNWFWGLGTWTTQDGVLRGFESGPRRHGPVKMHKCALKDAVVECEFRLEGKATFVGVIFNGSQERGHLFHVVAGKDELRLLAHPQKGKTLEPAKQPAQLATGTWHRVRIEFRGENLTAMVDEQKLTAQHPCIAEEKVSFGLGGDSGGPTGEKAGALEFRKLKITQL